MNPVRLTIHDLDSDDGAAIPVETDERELDLFKEQICRWIYGIKNQGFEPKTGHLCGTCDFTKLCGSE
ncbi:MAG TPA: PD-(D/E)XK nuclease family protein [Clostridia bacterium]|nr:PD-(D/E)XK nuclease family protein [Clostridia bacterium]